VWFDGGLPTDPSFQENIIALKEKYQPQAVAYNGFPAINDTAVRWIGSENGNAPDPTWSSGSCDQGNAGHGPEPEGGDPNSENWCPAEVDSTLQQGDNWFYIENFPLHSLSDLADTFQRSLGRNSNWILDIAPPPNSTVVASHFDQYRALGEWIRGCYDHPLAYISIANTNQGILPLGASVNVNSIRMYEDQTQGQLIHNYTVNSFQNGAWVKVSTGSSIGAGKIDLFSTVQTTQLQVILDSAPLSLLFQAFYCTNP